MRKKTICLGLTALALASWGGAARRALADKIYLKSGRQIEGTLQEEGATPDRVIVRLATGSIPLQRSLIDRVVKESVDPAKATESSGDLALAGGDLDGALDKFREALRAQPENGDLRRKIADLRARIKKRDDQIYKDAFSNVQGLIAAQSFEQAVEEALAQAARARSHPSAALRFRQMAAGARMEIARRMKDQVDYQRAEEQYRKAIAIDPDGPQACMELAGVLEMAPNRKAEAIEMFQRGLELALQQPGLMSDRSVLDYQYHVGRLYAREGMDLQAGDVFLQVARKDGGLAYPSANDEAVVSYGRLVDADSGAKVIDHVVVCLGAILHDHPDNYRAALLLGRILIGQDKWQAARDALEQGSQVPMDLASSPPMQDIYYQLGLCQRHLGDLVKAAACFQALIDKNAGTYDALCELGEIRLQQSSCQQALDLFGQARQRDDGRYRAYLGLGDTLVQLEHYPEALDSYNQVVTRDPTNYRVRLAIGKTRFLQGQANSANDAAQWVIAAILEQKDKAPDPPTRQLLTEAYVLSGQAYLSDNQTNRAREQMDKALATTPRYAPALDGIGKSYQAEGRHVQAQAFFRQAIGIDPKNPDYRLSMAISYHKYLQDPAKALPYYVDYMKLGGKDPNVKRWIADCGGDPSAIGQ
jgi:tetratricopeptide (TPR) repeat protein